MTKLRLVVLIDGENITCDYADEIFEKTDNLGDAVVRRVYLPHGETRQEKIWKKEVIRRHGIEPIYRIRYTTNRKNTMDIAMVLEAMDLMHRGRSIYDGFCIVSNDSDFIRLAMRLREEGFKVFGFGNEDAHKYLGPSCSEFIPLTKSHDTELAEKATEMIRNAIQKIEDEWVSLGQVGNSLREIDPKFKISDYGYKKLKDLVVEKSEFFETRPGKDAKNLDVRVHEKNEE